MIDHVDTLIKCSADAVTVLYSWKLAAECAGARLGPGAPWNRLVVVFLVGLAALLRAAG